MLVGHREISDLPDDRVVIISTGLTVTHTETMACSPSRTKPSAYCQTRRSPQFDDLLDERSARENDPTMELDAQLIGRYSTGAILARVKATYENRLNQWDCVEEDGFVRYFLRVQPDYGVRRLASAPSALLYGELATCRNSHESLG